ncbi:MAG: biotin transporter BioY [Gemmatimonadota bacterium]
MTTYTATISQDKRIAVAAVLGFAIALAAASQVALPLPGTPVPLTLQPMIVVLAGMMLGPTLGTASMVLYLAAGALGAPVFAPIGAPGIARLFGPTGGYLIAYPAAAALAGLLAQRFPTLIGRWAAATLGIAVIFIGGLTQLTIMTGSVTRAMALGITPFAVFDVVKAFVAALIARPRARSATE